MAEAVISSAGRRTALRADIGQVTTDWSFEPSPAPARVHVLRARARLRRRPPPAWQVIRAPLPAVRWNVLFLFAPAGQLDADQCQILARLRRLTGQLLVVVASPGVDAADAVELQAADALVWKELRGFDMSAYEVALRLLAERSPGATVYVQNDSVFGPFGDLDGFVDRAAWDLTGFLASSSVENHISSYAFIIRGLTPSRHAALKPVLPPSWCYDGFNDVVLGQETRLARIAARSMTVGAFWYMPVATPTPPLASTIAKKVWGERSDAPIDLRGNLLLSCPLDLLNAGHPFLKRSLFTKFAGLEDPQVLHAELARRGWT